VLAPYSVTLPSEACSTYLVQHLMLSSLVIGLKNSPTSPCLFVGQILKGGPPICIGIYVDDIIYFSSCDAVERKFEEQLSQSVSVDFMGQVSHFLGIEFAWQFHEDAHLIVNLTQQSLLKH
jgi:hypothetical protein